MCASDVECSAGSLTARQRPSLPTKAPPPPPRPQRALRGAGAGGAGRALPPAAAGLPGWGAGAHGRQRGGPAHAGRYLLLKQSYYNQEHRSAGGLLTPDPCCCAAQARGLQAECSRLTERGAAAAGQQAALAAQQLAAAQRDRDAALARAEAAEGAARTAAASMAALKSQARGLENEYDRWGRRRQGWRRAGVAGRHPATVLKLPLFRIRLLAENEALQRRLAVAGGGGGVRRDKKGD